MYKWSKENNLSFNTEKFQLLRYGKDDELKRNEYSLPVNYRKQASPRIGGNYDQ